MLNQRFKSTEDNIKRIINLKKHKEKDDHIEDTESHSHDFSNCDYSFQRDCMKEIQILKQHVSENFQIMMEKLGSEDKVKKEQNQHQAEKQTETQNIKSTYK